MVADVLCAALDAVFVLVEIFVDYLLNRKDKTGSESNDDRDTRPPRKKFRVRLAERRQQRAAKARHVLGQTVEPERQNRRNPAD